MGTYQTGVFDEGAAEIIAFDAPNAQIFVVNANDATVDVLDASDVSAPVLGATLDPVAALSGSWGAANSVAVNNGVLAVAIEADPSSDPGIVAFYDTTALTLLGTAPVGPLPDMIAFTPDGNTLLVANEGEPDDDYVVDPEGSVSVIDLSAGAGSATSTLATFNAFDSMASELREEGVRIYGPGASVSQDLEPEYVAVSEDGLTAWVTLQENNALAVIDIATATVTDILPLGYKDHSVPGNEMDVSNKDGGVFIESWPVLGLYQPDAIASWSFFGVPYLISANEGDARDYDGYSEEVRVEDLTLDPDAFPDAATLQQEELLGRLKTTTASGDVDDDGDHDIIYAYGGRSFSIWNGLTGQKLFDSGNEFEVILANRYGVDFNQTNDENGGDDRSDDKGCEPEGVVLGRIGTQVFAFIGLERMGGVMVYEVTQPESPRFVQYINNRDLGLDFDGDDPKQLAAAGDLGPEGLVFVDASDSPSGTALLIVGNEVSGSTTIYEVYAL